MIFKKGYRITQKFGENPDYYKQWGFKGHEGLDGVPKSGSWDILAVEGGTIVRDVDIPRDNYGKYTVVLNKSKGRAWWYCHLASNCVKSGDVVRKDQKIGVMGETGKVTGAHLHLGVRLADKDGNAINTDNGYKGFLDPLHILEGEKIENYYRGIDLDNTDSVKACIDTWREVVDGSYKRKEEFDKLRDEFNAEREASNVRIKEERKRYKDFVAALAEKLGSNQEEPVILEEITRAIAGEDRAVELEKKLTEQGRRVKSQEETINGLREELAVLKKLKIDNYNGRQLIIKGLVKLVRGKF